ncbi:pyridoxal kinase [Agrilactobacillus composti DSM 18527 = JCM 14202]|uniref:pyridoxal kinase n=1 Tax=Agrilactobacillus composti DSM 18527 = JCM 14202 TaxID=1423734 RepID=A0A0R1XTE1_9LACO|nr:pyridoxamine kinase [Agrilactobacillus composti]KRM30374.1 pyridoxal kinase [Agrilactobacillus composti DSM 18527 = JCM 14202]
MAKSVKPFLIGEDLSAVGRISLACAIPIFSACNIPQALAPTSLLSAQTEGFGTPVNYPMTQWLKATFAHWQSEQIQLSGALIGYLGNTELVDLFATYLATQNMTTVVMDPVMGDSGALYPAITADNVQAIRHLIQQATVITPNLTEAQLLTGAPLQSVVSEAQVGELFEKLATLTQADVVITGVPQKHGQIATYLSQDQKIEKYIQKKLSGHFFGAGDTFAAVLSCALYHNMALPQAVTTANELTWIALEQTQASDRERRYGLQLSELLRNLQQKITYKI